MKLSEKIAVVTGGSRGIGASISKKLGYEGATVAVVYKNNAEKAKEVVKEIRSNRGEARAFQADVSDYASIQQLLENILNAYGKIDILVNNAGIFEMKPLKEVDQTHVSHLFKTNFESVLYMTQAFAPYFPTTGGRIVNISTSLMYAPRSGTAIYSATKAAVSVLTNAFAKELGEKGITVNAVAPSMVKTDMTSATPEARIQAIIANTPVGRIGEGEDIANIVAFFASDESKFITGRTLLADGGLIDRL